MIPAEGRFPLPSKILGTTSPWSAWAPSPSLDQSELPREMGHIAHCPSCQVVESAPPYLMSGGSYILTGNQGVGTVEGRKYASREQAGWKESHAGISVCMPLTPGPCLRMLVSPRSWTLHQRNTLRMEAWSSLVKKDEQFYRPSHFYNQITFFLFSFCLYLRNFQCSSGHAPTPNPTYTPGKLQPLCLPEAGSPHPVSHTG